MVPFYSLIISCCGCCKEAPPKNNTAGAWAKWPFFCIYVAGGFAIFFALTALSYNQKVEQGV